MNKLRPFVWLLLFGSFWGMSELIGGEILNQAEVALMALGGAGSGLALLWILGRIVV